MPVRSGALARGHYLIPRQVKFSLRARLYVRVGRCSLVADEYAEREGAFTGNLINACSVPSSTLKEALQQVSLPRPSTTILSICAVTICTCPLTSATSTPKHCDFDADIRAHPRSSSLVPRCLAYRDANRVQILHLENST